jgi:hypothetical protein
LIEVPVPAWLARTARRSPGRLDDQAAAAQSAKLYVPIRRIGFLFGRAFAQLDRAYLRFRAKNQGKSFAAGKKPIKVLVIPLIQRFHSSV